MLLEFHLSYHQSIPSLFIHIWQRKSETDDTDSNYKTSNGQNDKDWNPWEMENKG